ncbi:MAG: hypothetical protein E7C39_06510 [Intestinibacter bartlettii]|uniref:hypothetical protein n=1 Tax=Intestinibacter bartlettii TaxID=261299 RepID=UPI002902F132|nr:hypothetical protein [Intestinibacter bartlettii]MDU2693765.1 hypothetical protein [Intestinibacter bartlettii]
MIIHEKLAHLSSKQIIQLMDEYYAGVRVKKLIEDYKVNCRPNDLHKYFPPIVLDKKCPICGENFLNKRLSKTEIENQGNPYRKIEAKKPYCPSCGHIDDDICECAACVEKRKKEQIKREAELKKMANEIKIELEKSYTGKVSVDELGFKDRIYLASLLGYGLSDDANVIKSLSECENSYSCLAEGDMDERIVDYLLKRNIIIIDTSYLVYAFKQGKVENKYMRYKLNVEIDDNNIGALQGLMSPKIDFSDENNIVAAYNLWKEVAMNDCIAFLVNEMRKKNVEFCPVKKTYILIDSMLKHFSTLQVQYIIYKSIDEISSKYTKSKPKRGVFSDIVFRRMEYWDSSMTYRESELPEYRDSKKFLYNNLHGVLFSKVLGLGDKGLRCVANIKIIRESVRK